MSFPSTFKQPRQIQQQMFSINRKGRTSKMLKSLIMMPLKRDLPPPSVGSQRTTSIDCTLHLY